MQKISPAIQVGKINKLEISQTSEYGYYLQSTDEEKVLLPNRYIEEGMKTGDVIEVFIHHDSDDRLVATTETPTAILGEFGMFEVVDTTAYGAFVDWGLPKDLFVPLSQQKEHFRVGDKKILRVALDEKTGRLYATQRIGKYFSKNMKGLKPGMKVDIFVIASTPLGYKVIANDKYEGMIYKNEIFTDIKTGDRLIGYIKKVRVDKKLDISLQELNSDKKSLTDAQKILNYLQKEGEIKEGYKLSPQKCSELFGMSRKAYKRALTALKEDTNITVGENGEILLIDK